MPNPVYGSRQPQTASLRIFPPVSIINGLPARWACLSRVKSKCEFHIAGGEGADKEATSREAILQDGENAYM